MNWQIIDSAPKDGSIITLYVKDTEFVKEYSSIFHDCKFINGYWWRYGIEIPFLSTNWIKLEDYEIPTHWIKIDPPKE